MARIAAVVASSHRSQLTESPATANHSRRTRRDRSLRVAAGGTPDRPAAAAEEIGNHGKPEAVLIARRRRQQRAAAMHVSDSLVPERRANLVQDMQQPQQPDRDLGEIGPVVLPERPQPARGRRQKVEVERFQRRPSLTLPRHVRAGDGGVSREHETGELLHLLRRDAGGGSYRSPFEVSSVGV